MTGFKRVVCNDRHEYLIAMLRGVQSGYDLPESVTEDEYKTVRDNKDADPVLAGFVGFGCSFGGKWFGGYARDKVGTNHAAQSKKSLLRDMATLSEAEFSCRDYREVPIPKNAVVYADPPYNNTTGYSVGKFDSEEFWKCMRLIAQTGQPYPVIIHRLLVKGGVDEDAAASLESKDATQESLLRAIKARIEAVGMKGGKAK